MGKGHIGRTKVYPCPNKLFSSHHYRATARIPPSNCKYKPPSCNYIPPRSCDQSRKDIFYSLLQYWIDSFLHASTVQITSIELTITRNTNKELDTWNRVAIPSTTQGATGFFSKINARERKERATPIDRGAKPPSI